MKLKNNTYIFILLLIININSNQNQQSNQPNPINDIDLNKTIQKMKILDSIFQSSINSKYLSNEAKDLLSEYKFAFYKKKTEFSNEEKLKFMKFIGKAYESYKDNQEIVNSINDLIKDSKNKEENKEISKTVIFLMESLLKTEKLKANLGKFIGFDLDLNESLVKTMLEVNQFQVEFDRKKISNQSRSYFKLLLSIIFLVVIMIFITFYYVFSYNKKIDL